MLSIIQQKKLFSHCLYLLVIASVTGCDFAIGKKGSTANDAPAVEATKVVNYTNAIVEVMRSYTGAAEDAVSYYTDLKEHMAGTRSFRPSHPSSMETLWTEKEAASQAFGEPSASLGNDQPFFKDSLGLYERLFKTFTAQDSTLALYITAEDYKDDDFAKGKALIDKQNEIYPQLVMLRRSIETKVELVANAAEEISLKDSPIREAYKAAKSDLGKFRTLANMIAEKETFTAAELAAIDTKYTELTSSIETNKNADKSKLDKENRTSVYVNFYTALTQQSAELKTIIRNIKQTKTLTEDEYNSLNNIYNQVVYAYNSWVG